MIPQRLNTYLFIIGAALSFATVNTAYAKSFQSKPKGKVHAALRITSLEGLQFGTIAPHTTLADTVVVDASSDDSSACGTQVTCLESGDRARFRITGRANMPINVTVTPSITLTNGTGGSMVADNFVLHAAGFGNGSGIIQGSGSIEVGVGATLNIGANQAVGAYTGTFTVTASYQ